jgi:hypothetical protein
MCALWSAKIIWGQYGDEDEPSGKMTSSLNSPPAQSVLSWYAAFPLLEVEDALCTADRAREEAEWVVFAPLLAVKGNELEDSRLTDLLVAYRSSCRRAWQRDIVRSFQASFSIRSEAALEKGVASKANFWICSMEALSRYMGRNLERDVGFQ